MTIENAGFIYKADIGYFDGMEYVIEKSETINPVINVNGLNLYRIKIRNIKEEVTRIRLNANYYEFQVLDDNLYDVDIVVENDKEVTVNRCSCGSIACAHLACCYERINNLT